MQKEIDYIEQGLKERKQMSKDFYHKEKAEAMLSALRDEARKAKDDVQAVEHKVTKVNASYRNKLASMEKKEARTKQDVELIEAYLKQRTNDLRALKLAEKQIERQLNRVGRKSLN